MPAAITKENKRFSLSHIRDSFEYRTGIYLRGIPNSREKLESSDLYRKWWYYSMELMPGLVTKGIYAPDLPLLPRLMLRKCQLEGMSCLDMGTMEGLIPVLMDRMGAREVLAIDATHHCLAKIKAVKHYYGAKFDFKRVALMYGLDEKLKGRGFDLINCSGLLYHVFSPLTVLSGVRPLLKRNGLMIVSTNVVLEDGYTMEFNNGGRLQIEPNTFWYISVKLFDYMLRYLKLAPLDCLFVPHEAIHSDVKYLFDKRSGYLSVLCQATDSLLPTSDDEWMMKSGRDSWEYQMLASWRQAARQSISKIKYRGPLDKRFFRPDVECLDLWTAVQQNEPLTSAQESDSHTLKLSDWV